MTLGFAAQSVAEEMTRWRVVNPNANPPEPIGGAKVLVRYRGTAAAPGHSSSICTRALLTETDADGWFAFPNAEQGRIPSAPYKVGYRQRKFGEGYLNDPKQRLVFLVPWTESDNHADRMEQFRTYYGQAGCAQIGDNDQPLIDFQKALLPELRAMVNAPETLRLLNDIEAEIRLREQSPNTK